MCGNRVEELEARVQELEASVEGLTDELVECKVRIRELENTVDDENGFSQSDEEQAADAPAEPADAEPAETTETADAADEASESTEGEIIVPEADTSNTEGPEGSDKTADPEAESDSEDDAGSDIIVA
jgi:uncharacterized coiled-coil protein SlyX